MRDSKNPIGNRTRDFPPCSAMRFYESFTVQYGLVGYVLHKNLVLAGAVPQYYIVVSYFVLK
jgi:hypothetical protein